MSKEAEALLQELSKAVLDWERVDDDVKECGWTSTNEQPWDEARARMVELAHKVHDKESINERYA
jgi:hypothetical protein